MKRLCSYLVFLLVVSQLFAATYRVRSYSFNVEGKTKHSSLSEFVGNPGDTFESLGQLDAFLSDKRQQLVNKRVFLDVEFSYEIEQTGEDEFDADVVFHIVDASTFLIVPYPKYDSNYGLNLKLKAKDSNFLGTFTTLDATVAFTQRENSFKDGVLEWDFSVDALKVKDAKISFSQIGAMDFMAWTKSYLGASTKISNVKMGDVVLSGSFSFKFSPKGLEKDSRWGARDISSSVGISFLNPKMNGASASNSLRYTFDSKEFYTSTSFTFLYNSKLGIKSSNSVSTWQYGFDDGLYRILIGTGVSKGFTFFKKLNFSPSLWAYVNYYFKTGSVDPYLVLTLPFSYGRIDWVDNNFRKGFEFSLSGTDTYHILNNKDFFHFLKLTGEMVFHYPVAAWFNPSARLNFLIANSAQTINTVSSPTYSSYLRGIRDDNSTLCKGGYYRFAMALNLDLMVNFIRINDFCSTYAIPFMDIFMGGNLDGSFDKMFTVGAEGIVILDSHPSYPIRGSLGFNAEELVSAMKGEMNFTDVEFELFIGLYFFY